ncbi:MAG: class I SAM-dependent methyltransferase [Acidilobus sp.]
MTKFKVEIVGDIAIIKPRYGAQPALQESKYFADRLLEHHNYIKSAWLAVSPVQGPYKVRQLVHLAGEERTETVYKEHGCAFKVDVSKDFITPRLSYEHIRVARLVSPGEVVVNMFAGVGTFSIIIARHSQAKLIHSIDVNPDAYNHMVENIRLNRVEDRVIPHLGDAAQVIIERLSGVADRVLMPLPDLALSYLPYAVQALRGKGVIHVYLHVHASKNEEPESNALFPLEEAFSNLNVDWMPEGARIVRMVGPRFYQVVVDVRASVPR